MGWCFDGNHAVQVQPALEEPMTGVIKPRSHVSFDHTCLESSAAHCNWLNPVDRCYIRGNTLLLPRKFGNSLVNRMQEARLSKLYKKDLMSSASNRD